MKCRQSFEERQVWVDISMSKITFGLALDFWSPTIPLSRHLDDYTSLLGLAEQYGFHSVWAGEGHIQEPAPNHVPCPLTVLAALARSTELRLGTGVLLLALWHPLRLAHEAALLDQISNGRLILGVGVGHPHIMHWYGISPDEAASRMDENLFLLKKLWDGVDSYQGRHVTISSRVYPEPLQAGGPPIWVGGGIRRSLERAASMGDGWFGAAEYHLDTIRSQALKYRKLVKAQGKDPSATTVCLNRATFLAESDEQANREVKDYISPMLNFYSSIGHLKDGAGKPLDPQNDYYRLIGEEFCFIGSPESCTQRIRKYVDEAGANHINFWVRFSDMPLEHARRTIVLLGESVIPQFNRK